MSFFAARQPILTKDKTIYGYELLFRNSTDNVFPNVDPEKATSKMIEGLQLDLGLDKITDDSFAFINFTEDSILKAYPNMLPKQKVVIEVLENVEPSPAVFYELKALADEGYIIALDDFVHSSAWEDFYSICHIIKIDCITITQAELSAITELKKRYPHLMLLAEKVEDYETFEQYQQLGFDLFQGYFFSKPEVIRSVSISPSQNMLTNLLNEIFKSDYSIQKITSLLEADVAISFKLLRYTQSSLFARRSKIDSIKQAVVMLGQKELERFVMLLFAASVTDDKPTELVRLSMQRAKLCESLAILIHKGDEGSSAFLVGMMSLVDAMLDTSIEKLVGTLPLSDNIKLALISQKGWLASLVLVCKQLETGDWKGLDQSCHTLEIDVNTLSDICAQSIEWAQQRLQLLKS